jgi:hypothetical protein
MHNCTRQSEDFVDNESIVDSNSRAQETQGISNGNNLVCMVCILCSLRLLDVDMHVTIMKYFGELKTMFFCDGNRMCLKCFEEEMQ